MEWLIKWLRPFHEWKKIEKWMSEMNSSQLMNEVGYSFRYFFFISLIWIEFIKKKEWTEEMKWITFFQ